MSDNIVHLNFESQSSRQSEVSDDSVVLKQMLVNDLYELLEHALAGRVDAYTAKTEFRDTMLQLLRRTG